MKTRQQYLVELESIQRDFNMNLGPEISRYINMPLTMDVKDSIRLYLDEFLERNDLGIKLLIVDKGESLYIIGRTLVDELVWSRITENYNYLN